jgi:hypothetical protein
VRLETRWTKTLDTYPVRTAMTFDDWDVQSDEDAAERTAFYRSVNRRRFLQAQEDRDTGNELDPLLFEPRDEEEE